MRRTLLPLLAATLIGNHATPASAAPPDEPARDVNPFKVAGVRFTSPPAELNNRPGAGPWYAVVVREPIDVYRARDTMETIALRPEDAPKYGEVFNIIEKTMPGVMARSLIARWRHDKDRNLYEMVHVVGWVDDEVLLDSEVLVSAHGIRSVLEKQAGEKHPLAPLLRAMLPMDARDERYQNVILKALSHPSRASMAFRAPVASERLDEETKAGRGSELQRFAFYYVAKVVVDEKDIQCLLTTKGSLPELRIEENPDLRAQLVGWVDLRQLVYWSTREGFAYNLSEAARKDRMARGAPIGLVSSSYRDKPDQKPVIAEAFDAPEWQRPPGPRGPRLYVLDRYDFKLGGEGLRGYPICVPFSGSQLTKDRQKVAEAVDANRVFELVIVVDRTASMRNSFPKLREALKELVAGMRMAFLEPTRPSHERIDLRVAVVGYQDFTAKQWNDAKREPTRYDRLSRFLVEDSGRFYRVCTNERDFDACLNYIGGLTVDDGGDIPEEPFEGIHHAVNKFLKLRKERSEEDRKLLRLRMEEGAEKDRAPVEEPEHHSAGASKMIVLFGDAPNHAKEPAGQARLTKYDSTDVLNMLEPLGRQDELVARVMFHAVWVNTNAFFGTDDGKRIVKLWDDQMTPLVTRTGGGRFTLEMATPEDQDKAGRRLSDELRAVVQAKKDQHYKAIETFFQRNKNALTELSDGDWAQIVPDKAERERIKANLLSVAPGFFHVAQRLPGDAEDRVLTEVLMTSKEVRTILGACERLAKKIRDGRKSAGAIPERDRDRYYKEIVIRAMFAAFADEDPEPEEVRKWLAKPYADLEAKLSVLPVRFGVLERLKDPTPVNFALVESQLNHVILSLDNMMQRRPIDRWFEPVLGVSEQHAWVRPDELP